MSSFDGRLTIVGRGRAAEALGPRWAAAGFEVATWSRDDGPLGDTPHRSVIVLAVSDRAIREVAETLATRTCARDELWLHLSGATPAAVLRVGQVPRAVGCLHPLVALAAGADLRGAVAGIEGEPEAVPVAETLARAVGLVPQAIPAERALYHAAAVSVAGHATALFSQAMAMLETLGMPPEVARAALAPLLLSAAKNLAKGDPASVLTGPSARGDATTVRAHVAAIDTAFGPTSDAARTYRALSRTALGLVADRLTPDVVLAIASVVREPSK